ncbi:MAG: hypothetical protein EP335_06140 [Alphaproteobacteria bacterium]|nr:MAG: hypothetical protein EP335_06140 [Alphaproteobacteria bacterium]
MKSTLEKVVCLAPLALFALIFSQTDRDYFPPQTCKVLTDIVCSWYQNSLKVAGEPSLYQMSKSEPSARTYRFLWLRSSGSSVSFRISFDSVGNASLETREFTEDGQLTDTDGNPLPAQVLYSDTLTFKAGELAEFEELANVLAPCFEIGGLADLRGFDGSEWFVEANIDGDYRALSRWSPLSGITSESSDPVSKKVDQAMYNFGSELMRLSGRKFDSVY